MRLQASLSIVAVLLGGCATRRPPSADVARPASAAASSGERRDAPPAITPEAARQQSAEQLALAAALQAVDRQQGDYFLAAGDLIEVSVYREAELLRQVRVSQNGVISFPLIGEVKVLGLSVLETERLISQRLTGYLVSPQVTVFIKEYKSKQIYVLGEVAKPGSFGLPPETKMTVVEAIALAGGFTAVAAPDRTRVIRRKAGQSETLLVEVSAITRRGEKDRDIPLEPNDVVFVPQSFF